MTEPAPGPDGRLAPQPGRWTKQSAGATFAAVAAFAVTRDATFGFFRRTLPAWAYTSTVLASLAASAVAYGLAVWWIRRLP